jgi:hypothetical protein
MDAKKTEFIKLAGVMGWSQTETARRLHKTPSAINHLMNPSHPNKPTRTTLQLLKLIIAGERPDLFSSAFKLKANPAPLKADSLQLSRRELALMTRLRRLTPREQTRAHTLLNAVLRSFGKPVR